MHNIDSQTGSLINKAFSLLKKDNREGALSILFNILETPIKDIKDSEVLTQLGDLASRLNESIAAINIFSDLISRFPDNAIFPDKLGQVYIDNKQLYLAEPLFHKAIELNPDLYHPYFGLGYIALQHNQVAEAIEFLEKALVLKPGETSIYINLVSALILNACTDKAYEYAKKLLRMNPDSTESCHLMGRVLAELGQFDEAIDYFLKAIRLDRTYGYSYDEMSSIKKFSSADHDFIQRAEKTLQMSMEASRRSAIHFALGKIYNDCNEWDKAFEHYRQGNLIAKPAVPDESDKIVFERAHKCFRQNVLQQAELLGSDSNIPVFIVGMPRSGTTLIEQIISCHPEGAGAGELGNILGIQYKICPYEELGNYRQKLNDVLNKDTITDYAEDYLAVLRNGRKSARRIVDKMPVNYTHLGLIHLLFPKSCIIHAVRSPLDVSLSCFFQSFAVIDWSYDLEWIANEYKFYRKAIKYWKKVLPEGRIIDVNYDDLVENSELNARKIIEGIGLEWDPACLEFHKKKRSVSTASLWQVRQPVYKSSKKRWVNYINNIENLANRLKDYLDDSDLEELEKHGIQLRNKWYNRLFG